MNAILNFEDFELKELTDKEQYFILSPENASKWIEVCYKNNYYNFADHLIEYENAYSCLKVIS